jgi:hypothetical protein
MPVENLGVLESDSLDVPFHLKHEEFLREKTDESIVNVDPISSQ